MGGDPRLDDAAGCSTGSAAPTGRSSAAATRMWPPPAAASPRPPTSNQPCDCWKSTATCVGSTLNLPATHRAVADRPHRGSWSTLCHAPQKSQKPQKPPPEPFLWILWRVARVPNERRSARHGRVRDGRQGRFSCSRLAVTLSNENGSSRSRPTRHPPAAASGRQELPWAASEPLSRTGLDTADGRAWTRPSVGQSAGQIPRCGCRDIGGRGRWRR